MKDRSLSSLQVAMVSVEVWDCYWKEHRQSDGHVDVQTEEKEGMSLTMSLNVHADGQVDGTVMVTLQHTTQVDRRNALGDTEEWSCNGRYLKDRKTKGTRLSLTMDKKDGKHYVGIWEWAPGEYGSYLLSANKGIMSGEGERPWKFRFSGIKRF